MAKRKKKPAAVKIAGDPAEKPAVKPAGSAGKKQAIFLAVIAVFVIFTAGEIYFITMKALKQGKRPVFISSWHHNYKRGCTSIGQYGDYIYAIDSGRGDVYRNRKKTGKLEKIFAYSEGVYSALQNSAGDIYILTKNGQVIRIDGTTYAEKERIQPEGITNPVWMEVDSGDNLYLVSYSTNHVVKYGPDFKKLLQFGGTGAAGDKLSGAKKVFAGPDDNMYVMDVHPDGSMDVKIFTSGGKFLKSWKVTHMAKVDWLTNMAVDTSGYVYINAYQESRIYVYDNNGKFMSSFDSDKDKKYQIVYAPSVTGGKDGVIYVVSHSIALFEAMKY